MAKLSTPSHPCEQLYSTDSGVRWPCGGDAYRRFEDRWLCRPHLRSTKDRAARLRPDGVFLCVDCGHESPRVAQDPEWWVCSKCNGRMEIWR